MRCVLRSCVAAVAPFPRRPQDRRYVTLVRSDRAVPSCAACGVAKAARCATIGGGCQPRRATQEERARSRVQRARPRSRNPRSREDERQDCCGASAQPEPEVAGGRAHSSATDERGFRRASVRQRLEVAGGRAHDREVDQRVRVARPRSRNPRSRMDERSIPPRTSSRKKLLVHLTPKSLPGVKIAGHERHVLAARSGAAPSVIWSPSSSCSTTVANAPAGRSNATRM